MKLDYSVNIPTEEETNEQAEQDRRKNLMTRSSIQATLLQAMGGVSNPQQPMPQPNESGWGSVKQ